MFLSRKYAYFWLLCALFLSACGGGDDSEPPVPDFLIAHEARGRLVSFYTVPTGPQSDLQAINVIRWELGDGNTADSLYPSHYYAQPGEYTVSVVYVLLDGKRVSHEKTIQVDETAVCETKWKHVRGPSPWVFNDMTALNGRFMAVGNGGSLQQSHNGFEWCSAGEGYALNFTRIQQVQNQVYVLGHRATFDRFGRPRAESVLLIGRDGETWTPVADSDALLTDFAILGAELLAVGRVEFIDSQTQTLTSQGVIQRFNRGTNRFDHVLAVGEQIHEIREVGNTFWLVGEGITDQNETGGFFTWTSEDGAGWQSIANNGERRPSIPRGQGLRQVNLHENLVYLQENEWLTATYPGNILPKRIFYSGDRFFVWTEDRLLTSTGGRNWDLVDHPPFPNREVVSIAYNQFIWQAFDKNGPLLWSGDGISWQVHPKYMPDEPEPLNAIAHTRTGFAVTGSDGLVLTSPNGSDWFKGPNDPSARYYGAAESKVGLLLAGERANPEEPGVIWLMENETPRIVHAKREPVYVIAAASSMVVALTRGGAVERSRDDETRFWETTAQLETPLSLKVFDDEFWLVTNNGRLFRSRNARDWTEIRWNNFSVRAVGYRAGTFLIAGDHLLAEGAPTRLYRGNSQTAWEPVDLPFAMQVRFVGADDDGFTLAGNRFVAVDDETAPSQATNFVFSEDGVTWQPQQAPPVTGFNDMRVTNHRALTIDNQGRMFLRERE